MGTHPIFESDFDCLTDFGSGTDDGHETTTTRTGGFWSTEPESEPDRFQIDSEGDSDCPKCPICLVNSTINVKTNCNHDFCLQCIFRMWTSENSDNDEDEVERPFICPMCRLTVTKLIWKGSANQMTPNELSEYNQLSRNYKPQARQTSQKYSSALIILYLLIFLQISPFLSPIIGFIYQPKANTSRKGIKN